MSWILLSFIRRKFVNGQMKTPIALLVLCLWPSHGSFPSSNTGKATIKISTYFDTLQRTQNELLNYYNGDHAIPVELQASNGRLAALQQIQAIFPSDDTGFHQLLSTVLLSDRSPDLRRAAAKILASINYWEEPLIQDLVKTIIQDPDADVVSEARRTLLILRRYMKAEQKNHVAWVIGEIDLSRAVPLESPVRIDTLKTLAGLNPANQPSAQMAALEALAEKHALDSPEISLLVDFTRNINPGLRNRALVTLAMAKTIPDEALALLNQVIVNETLAHRTRARVSYHLFQNRLSEVPEGVGLVIPMLAYAKYPIESVVFESLAQHLRRLVIENRERLRPVILSLAREPRITAFPLFQELYHLAIPGQKNDSCALLASVRSNSSTLRPRILPESWAVEDGPRTY
jgi:hypothetical protein